MYRIMIVDDEPNILKSLRRALRKKTEWDVETYVNVDEALRRAQTNTFDLFITDYKMPRMDGVEFLNEIRKHQPEAMRVMLSGFTDLQLLLDAINEAQIFRFICKPWNDHDLIATINHALAHRDILIENRQLADQVRQQQQELERHKSALEKLAEQHPALVDVNWADDGSIIVEDGCARS